MKFYPLFFFSAFLTLACGKTEEGPLPQITFSSGVIVEGASNSIAVIKATLSEVSSKDITFKYKTTDGTATAGADYVSKSADATIAAGQTSIDLTFEILNDGVEETNEFFRIEGSDVTNATFKSPVTSVTINNDDVFIPTLGNSSPLTYPGKSLTWSDEFNGTALDLSAWTPEIGNGNGGWGNNELQFYRAENTTVKDGYLIIEARTESYAGFNYTSSRLITKGKKEFKFGRIDIRAALPETQGIWPALWMLGANIGTVNWPACGEIDIMEVLGHEPNKTYGTVHYGTVFPDNRNISRNLVLPDGKKFSDRFHVFSIIWEQDRIEWLVDDQSFAVITPNDLGGYNYPFNEPFFFIMNVAVGGNWPGAPNNTTQLPQQMIVDYVRVFQ
jgi:hypothetical protein